METVLPHNETREEYYQRELSPLHVLGVISSPPVYYTSYPSLEQTSGEQSQGQVPQENSQISTATIPPSVQTSTTEPQFSQENLSDRIYGMFYGHALGDALGAPHEFRYNRSLVYTGNLVHETIFRSKYQGQKIAPIGAVTDDTQMTIALLRALVSNRLYYLKDSTIFHYIRWASTVDWRVGKNTAYLFKNIKTKDKLKTYQGRINKELEKPEDQRSSSNGCLMRALPLVIFSGMNFPDGVVSIVNIDTNITNPTEVCREAVSIYLLMVRLALRGLERIEIWQKIVSLPQTPEVKRVINQITFGEIRDTVTEKGFVCHALWCAMRGLYYFNSYKDAIDWIITFQPGSDTDTNAAIAGGLLGAYYGLNRLRYEEEYNFTILNTVTGEFPDYDIKQYHSLIPAFIELLQSINFRP